MNKQVNRHFKVDTQVAKSETITTIYTVNIYCIEHYDAKFWVSSKLTICDIIKNGTDWKVQKNLEEELFDGYLETKREAVAKYQHLKIKGHTLISVIDDNGHYVNEESEVKPLD